MNITQAYYEERFQNLFLRAKGDEFQTLFERLMGLAYKADFMACRPWGKKGDKKNDGFLISEKWLFQVYAPNEMSETKATKKIHEDFDCAKVHWGKHFDKWVFAHNATGGLPPHVQEVLLNFQNSNPGIKIEPWCLEEFLVVFRLLNGDDLASWLGLALDEETKSKLGFNDLRPVLEGIAYKPVPPDKPIVEVPMGKIGANALSESVSTLIKAGISKAQLVEQFFAQWNDEALGDKIAEAIRSHYEHLKSKSLTPNEIFSELQSWAGGNMRGAPEHEMAVLTVLAYYFERCDIFEQPRASTK